MERGEHLSTSGGSLVEARLRWVRLKAELMNWWNRGRVSFTFLGEKVERRSRGRDIVSGHDSYARLLLPMAKVDDRFGVR